MYAFQMFVTFVSDVLLMLVNISGVRG